MEKGREAALEEEIEKMKKDYENQRLQLMGEFQQKMIHLKEPWEIEADGKEVKVAAVLLHDYTTIYKSAKKFAGYRAKDLGMLNDPDGLPDKTTDKGYAELQKTSK